MYVHIFIRMEVFKMVRMVKPGMEQEARGEDVCQERSVHPEHMLAVRRNLMSADMALRIAELFGVLGDPTRLQVVYALLSAPTGELCVCDLASGMGRDDTTISHQLRVLRNHKIVAMRKAGRVVYYRLIDEHVRQLLELGMEHANEAVFSAFKKEAEVLV
jgi:ArsR family transcriptional regulator, lead/cadmium/zinc/bismuth-responsive transcriptional repressor